MRNYRWALILAVASLLGCARRPAITDGAEDVASWNRRLQAAVPLGTPLDQAQSTMERNGFHCTRPATVADPLWCDKHSGGRLTLVSRRWLASMELQGQRVTAVRGNTGLIGP